MLEVVATGHAEVVHMCFSTWHSYQCISHGGMLDSQPPCASQPLRKPLAMYNMPCNLDVNAISEDLMGCMCSRADALHAMNVWCIAYCEYMINSCCGKLVAEFGGHSPARCCGIQSRRCSEGLVAARCGCKCYRHLPGTYTASVVAPVWLSLWSQSPCAEWNWCVQGLTALHYSVMLWYLDMTRLLLSYGASVAKSVCKEALVSITLSVLINLQCWEAAYTLRCIGKVPQNNLILNRCCTIVSGINCYLTDC